jgi:hypothetical protein
MENKENIYDEIGYAGVKVMQALFILQIEKGGMAVSEKDLYKFLEENSDDVIFSRFIAIKERYSPKELIEIMSVSNYNIH